MIASVVKGVRRVFARRVVMVRASLVTGEAMGIQTVARTAGARLGIAHMSGEAVAGANLIWRRASGER